MRSSDTTAEWSRLVAEWKRSGLPAGEFAAQRGIGRSTLYWWSSQLKRQRASGERAAGKVRLVPVELDAAGAAPSLSWELSMASGHVLRAFGGVDTASLTAILSALARVEGR